jgi:ankyrin repeat protein
MQAMKKLLLTALLPLLLAACGEPDRPSISLYLALQHGDIDQIERHIYWGTDINALDADGRRPLHVAAERGRTVVLELLLEHGADVNAPDQAGRTPIQRAVLNGRTQIADLLLQHGARLDPGELLLEAAAQGVQDRDVVRWLVGHGADLNQKDAAGDTALLLAARSGNHRLALHLVDEGADVNVHDAAGRSAIAVARAAGQLDIVSLLQRYGAAEP